MRDPTPAAVSALLAFRNGETVNRFTLRTYVEPEVFRREWLAVPLNDSDCFCVVELDGVVVAMGFLDIVDGIGQPDRPLGTRGVMG